jgi:hypothetical protein
LNIHYIVFAPLTFNTLYIIRPYHPIVNKAADAADRVAINAIVDEAADATADRVAVNATIVNVAARAVAGRVAAISDEAEGLVGAWWRQDTFPYFCNLKINPPIRSQNIISRQRWRQKTRPQAKEEIEGPSNMYRRPWEGM